MSNHVGVYGEEELLAARDLVRELVRVIRGHRLYEGDHPSLGELRTRLRTSWETATKGGPIAVRIRENDVLLEQEVVYTGASSHDVIPRVLYDHGVVGLVFHSGLEPGEMRRLLQVLAEAPDQSVDYPSLLWEADLRHLQVLLDSDELDDDTPCTLEEFVGLVDRIAEQEKAPPAVEFQTEQIELSQRLAQGATAVPGEQAAGWFQLTEGEREYTRHLARDDNYLDTVRHAARIVFKLAREKSNGNVPDGVDGAIPALVSAVCASGSVVGALEMIVQARKMIQFGQACEVHAAERTLEAFRDERNLWSFLRAIDRQAPPLQETLGEFLAQIGPEAAPTVSEWLVETSYPEMVASMMPVYGDSAVDALAVLYAESDEEARARVAPALMALATSEALRCLAQHLAELPLEQRLKLIDLVECSEDVGLRDIVIGALMDEDEAVRRAAVAALHRSDGPDLAQLLEDMFAHGVFDGRTEEEVDEFFETLSRIGEGDVARVLAGACLPSRFRLGFRLSPLQQLCVRALRRMRAPAARPYVEELRTRGPRAVRAILDDPLG